MGTRQVDERIVSVGALATLAYAAHQMRDRTLAAIARQQLEEQYGLRLTVIRRRPEAREKAHAHRA